MILCSCLLQMVASKFLNDDGEDDEVFNDEWAEAGGMDVKELNKKEIEFLCAIDWSIYVNPDDFNNMRGRLEASVARRQLLRRSVSSGSVRGATYTDLAVLLRFVNPMRVWQMLAESTLKVTAVCATAYAASVMAMIGTVCLLHETALAPAAIQNAFALRHPDSDPDHSTAKHAAMPRPAAQTGHQSFADVTLPGKVAKGNRLDHAGMVTD